MLWLRDPGGLASYRVWACVHDWKNCSTPSFATAKLGRLYWRLTGDYSGVRLGRASESEVLRCKLVYVDAALSLGRIVWWIQYACAGTTQGQRRLLGECTLLTYPMDVEIQAQIEIYACHHQVFCCTLSQAILCQSNITYWQLPDFSCFRSRRSWTIILV